ncbi:MAG: hypothetical protein ACJA2S_000784 [Cyclobacteriaceae bacterium]|jgi:hypothetical protein
MKSKVNESQIIDYLYGNLSDKEKQFMDEAMKKDPVLKQEIDEMASVMGFLGKSEDKEEIPPAFVFPNEHQASSSFFSSGTFKSIVSIAASLLILLLSAYVTGFYISKDSNKLLIGFNSDNSVQSISKDEVKGIMQEVMANYNQEQENKLESLDTKFKTQLESSKSENLNLLKEYMASNSKNSQEVMKNYIQQSNSTNRKMIADFFQVSTEHQQEYLSTVLTDFSKFYNNQRKEDLETIRTGLLDYRDSNDQKQYETELVLANLVDMVNIQNK